MDNRLNIGSEVRELKLGSTFTNAAAPSNQFHTIKYDFKPASVDVNKPAVLEISANKQVTVTVPHLDGSGVPNTVFKGNQRDYSRKDCVLILNRATGEITLEQLNSSIVVKKTRIENKAPNPPPSLPTIKVENNTARQSSKTKITTGVRKNAPISFMPKHSPLQGSPSYPHRSPQSAPAWNANNTQQTLPSIPMIGLDDGMDFGTVMPPSSSSTNTSNSSSSSSGATMNNHLNNNNISSSSGGSGSNSNHTNNHHHHQHSSSSGNSNVGNSMASSTNSGSSSTSNNHSNSSNSSYLNHGSTQNNNNHHGSSGSSGSNHHHHSNHLSVPSSYGGGAGGRNHLHSSEPSMPPSVEVSLPPDRDLLPPPVAVTGIGVGASSDPEMMTSSESDGSDDSDSSSSDQESDSSTEDNNDSPVKESIFDPRPDPTIAVTSAAVDLSKDLCLSSNSDSDD
ncbi:ell-associated factor Eaf [Anopheles stephensi]|uniref:Ell-associated factor Eaf n=2 Tax=Neocellia TaxID=44535 RepID=A0A182YCC0_ANOST|nr:ell-associated factor Eaf [Anopheles stephensi]XP_035893707.1 ell-associated factor Eaf [Anopheles stephensi]XP_035893709.1 ell-associated factor Eaf [Anopheles stephensi]XP_035893710.1 ell-associated factor Eaf [Anopheles stephensi]XP_035893711.1 ell-associated factor Eaf [Anopheles stephensi]